MLRLKTIKDIDLTGKRIFLRVDFNVPIEEKDGVMKVVEGGDWRIKFVLPTIKYLLDNNCSLIIASHLGRPGELSEIPLSLLPIKNKLENLLKKDVKFTGKVIDIENAKSLKSGEILLLENLRFDPREEEGDKDFAKELASMAEIYVNDAFGAAHRDHASLVAITEFLPSFAGFLMEKEVAILENEMLHSKHPLVLIMGGLKAETKIKVIRYFLGKADDLILGGALANAVLQSKGISIGASKREDDNDWARGDVKNIFKSLIMAETKTKLHLPIDVVVSEDVSGRGVKYTRGVGKVELKEREKILDIGSDTIKLFNNIILEAKSIIWNGPMGLVEVEDFAKGTKMMARAVANSLAESIVGGGETIAFLNNWGLADKFSHISTGGGAMLEFLAGEKLLALEKLKEE